MEVVIEYVVGSAIVLGALALFFGAGLAMAYSFFQVKVDPRVARIEEVLPRANCGSCGFAGCAGYAEALAKGEAAAGLCSPGGPEVAKQIAGILGVAVGEFIPKVAVVKCQGSRQNAARRFQYAGERDCRAATATQYGQKACQYSCMGFGTCVRACPFDAMVLDEEAGLPRVLEDRCTACGTCAAVCPKNIIEILPKERYVHVLCRNQDPARVVRQLCKAGCIACHMCEKVCPVEGSAIHVVGNLASVDMKACISCGRCPRVCPVSCIGDFHALRGKENPSLAAEAPGGERAA